MNISNISDLERELKKLILASMKEVGKIGEDTVKKHVQEDIYDKSKPRYYKRTGQLKKSVTRNVYQVGRETYAEIFHNKEVMTPIKPYGGNNYMGQHYSTDLKYNPLEYNEFVAQTINEGSSGKIFGSGFWTKKRPYFTNAEKFMKTSFRTILKAGLEYRGIKVK